MDECRICKENTVVLFKPCLCKNTNMHFNCLKLWLKQKPSNKCEVCNFTYTYEIDLLYCNHFLLMSFLQIVTFFLIMLIIQDLLCTFIFFIVFHFLIFIYDFWKDSKLSNFKKFLILLCGLGFSLIITKIFIWLSLLIRKGFLYDELQNNPYRQKNEIELFSLNLVVISTYWIPLVFVHFINFDYLGYPQINGDAFIKLQLKRIIIYSLIGLQILILIQIYLFFVIEIYSKKIPY